MGAVLGVLGAAGAAGAGGAAAGAAGGAAAAGAAGAAGAAAGAASGIAAGAGAAGAGAAGAAASGLGILATGAAGTAAKAGAAINPLAKFSLSWDNVGNAISDLAKTTKTGRTLSTLTQNGGFSWENTKEAVSDLAQEALRERFEQNGIAGRAAADALGLKGGQAQNANQNAAAQDGQAAVKAAANPVKHGVYGQFGAAPPVQAPRQAMPQFNAIDYYNSLMGNKNGQYQA